MADILDIERLAQLKSIGGPDLLSQMLDLYLEHAPERITGIIDGYKTKDFDRVKKNAHSLKSSSGNVGAMAFMDLCQEIELAAERANEEALKDLLDSFPGEARSVLRAVTAARDEHHD